MSRFIPSFHFDNPNSKLTPEWCEKVVNSLYYNTNRKNLLDGKNVNEIEKYAIGEFDMKEFKRLYRSIKKSFVANNPHLGIDMDSDNDDVDSKMLFEPLPLIPTKLNAAVSIIQKIPVEVTVTALDPLAAKKKDEDISFLKNKPAIEQDLQSIADQMQQPNINLGTTKHSYIKYSSSPYGIDLLDDEQADIFANIIYSLGVEVSFETALQIFFEIKKGNEIKALEILDQYKFGVSVHRASISRVTGLPDLEYKHPSSIETPPSKLRDFSDNTHRIEEMELTALELFNYFPNEIKSEEHLNSIINEKEYGYCACNKEKPSSISAKDFDTFKVTLLRFEVRSVDSIGVVEKSKGRGICYFTDSDDEKCSYKLWGQNTYCFYWLKNTKYFFDIHKLDYAHRSLGNETFQNFSTNIFRSQKTSAVELSIKENKRAQIADIKMQYAILMSLPAGKYIDLKYLRGAIEGLIGEDDDGDEVSDGSSSKYTMEYLIELALERNIILGDTEGFDGKHDGQFKPFMDIAGGVKTELQGYREVLMDAKKNISDFTGINDQLVGSSANPEGLIGLQKLLINSSINALYYANEAINFQEQCLFNTWASGIKGVIKKGGEPKKALVRMIGDKKANIIDRLDEVPLHNLGTKVTTSQREEERAKFEERKNRLKQVNAISVADEYMLDAIQNPKDKIALLAIREKQWQKKQDEIRQQAAQQQQDIIKAQGENMVQVKEADVDGKIKAIYAKGDTQAKLAELMSRLGLNQAQFETLAKKMLQDERNNAQVDKGVRMIEAKNNAEQSQSINQ